MKLSLILIWNLTILLAVAHGFKIRLWQTNEERTHGFVEAYHNGTWGFVGNPEFTFSDTTASVLCRILQIQRGHFGYGAGWTPLNNYYAVSAIQSGLECYGNETDAGQCKLRGNLSSSPYSEKAETSWAYKYGSRLYCTDSRLVNGVTENAGMVETYVDGMVYPVCVSGFIRYEQGADVLCRSLGYDKSSSVERTSIGVNNTYNGSVVAECNGHETSLSKCRILLKRTVCHDDIAYVTCEAVRLTSLNEHKDEGIVEVFHKGSWGLVGNPGEVMDDESVKHLCNRFGFGYTGFGVRSRHLGRHEGIAWLNRLSCKNNETNVMTCDHDKFRYVPPLMHTYRSGSSIFCFPFAVDRVRLFNGFRQNDGRVQLSVNGRWGSICTYNMKYADQHRAGTVLCRMMGYRSVAEVILDDNRGHHSDMFWMTNVVCNGTENTITDCTYDKGSMYNCYTSPVHLRIKCKGSKYDVSSTDTL